MKKKYPVAWPLVRNDMHVAVFPVRGNRIGFNKNKLKLHLYSKKQIISGKYYGLV